MIENTLEQDLLSLRHFVSDCGKGIIANLVRLDELKEMLSQCTEETAKVIGSEMEQLRESIQQEMLQLELIRKGVKNLEEVHNKSKKEIVKEIKESNFSQTKEINTLVNTKTNDVQNSLTNKANSLETLTRKVGEQLNESLQSSFETALKQVLQGLENLSMKLAACHSENTQLMTEIASNIKAFSKTNTNLHETGVQRMQTIASTNSQQLSEVLCRNHLYYKRFFIGLAVVSAMQLGTIIYLVMK